MKKTTIYLMLIFLYIQTSIAQQEQKVSPKYLTTLIYLKTDKEINQKIRNFNNKWLKKQKIKKNECVDFNLSKYVSYMPIPDLNYEVDYAKYTDSDSLVDNNKSHREKYNFELQEVPEFKKLVPNTESKLYLLFSKPIDNYLIVEFMIKTSNHEIDMSTLKRGPALHLLIFFDDNGLVEKVYTSGSYYN